VKPRVLIVDDEPRMGRAIEVALSRSGLECEVVTSGTDALAALRARGADCVVTDWKMPGMDGLDLLAEIRRSHDLPVIVVTAFADVPSAVSAMKQGAFDYVTKPFDNDDLRTKVQRALDLTSLARENRWLRQRIADAGDPIIAESARMRQVVALAKRVAPTPATVLIQGESGTGKEVIARLIHHMSDRIGRPFVAVNCKAFAETVLESELFGHEKGAFTGALEARAGCFERADGGTLFLDEIGEISEAFQAKLLRALQEREILPVGGSAPRAVDVRVVAATNRDLAGAVRSGRFREDLFFRLNVIPIQIPPLRERMDDLRPLIASFLEGHASRSGHRRTLSPEAMSALLAHEWPGNVRELENVIERAFILAVDEAICVEDLFLGPAPAAAAGVTLKDTLDRATEVRIRQALETHGGGRAEAAAELGVDRTTLYRLMKRLGMD
jgi:DNA-binding NtrC family response regulator